MQEFRPIVLHAAFVACGYDASTAEDIAQDTFHRFVKFRGLQNADPDKIERYLKAIAQNQARRQRVTRAAPNSHEAVHFDEGLRDMHAAISRLPEQDQELLELLLWNYSLQEISVALNISYSNAAVRLHRLRAKLAKLIGR